MIKGQYILHFIVLFDIQSLYGPTNQIPSKLLAIGEEVLVLRDEVEYLLQVTIVWVTKEPI